MGSTQSTWGSSCSCSSCRSCCPCCCCCSSHRPRSQLCLLALRLQLRLLGPCCCSCTSCSSSCRPCCCCCNPCRRDQLPIPCSGRLWSVQLRLQRPQLRKAGGEDC